MRQLISNSLSIFIRFLLEFYQNKNAWVPLSFNWPLSPRLPRPLIGHFVDEVLKSWLPTPPRLSLLPLISLLAAKNNKKHLIHLLFIVFRTKNDLLH